MIQTLSVFVEGLELQAEIGLYDHERGHTQPLSVDVELVETFAERLAASCLDHPRALAVAIRIRKPQAIPGAAAAGVQLSATKP